MTTVTQAEFARMEGKARSYITALKSAGRLVMVDGLVDVEASRARIAGTSDPNRDDVAQRWAKTRQPSAPAETPADKIGNSYQAARAVKEKFAAMQAKHDYEKAIGKIVDMDEAGIAQCDAMTLFSMAVNQFSQRVSAELVGKDIDFIRAVLKQEGNAMLTELSKAFDKWKTDYLESL